MLIALILYFTKFGLLLYILLAVFLPYKEDIIETRRQGPRRRKDAEPVDDDGWFW